MLPKKAMLRQNKCYLKEVAVTRRSILEYSEAIRSRYPKAGFYTELMPYRPTEDQPAEAGTPISEPKVIWYEDSQMMAIHRQLVRSGMNRARQPGKCIGRTRVIERPEFLERYEAVLNRIRTEPLSQRQAAKLLQIGYATLKRLMDAKPGLPLPACTEIAIENTCGRVLD